MSSEEKIIKAFRKVASESNMASNFAIAYLNIKSEQYTDHAMLNARICGYKATFGWLTLQSKNMLLNEWRENEVNYGFILSGELTDGSSSLHVRQSRDGWTLTEMKEEEGNDILLVETIQLASTIENQYLSYKVYWKQTDGLGYRATFSRFTGFTTGA